MKSVASFARVLDLDGSVRVPGAATRTVALRDLGPRLRYLCTRGDRRAFEARLAQAPDGPLTFFGSGDFHHLTVSLLRERLRAETEPVSLLLFDQHLDWDITSPWPCCGCWVNEALALPQVRRVVAIGAGVPDLGGWHLARGNTRALRSGKLEIYPYALGASRFWGAPRPLASGRIERHGALALLRWRTVAGLSIEALLRDVLLRLPTRSVYVSVDKDVLRASDAHSNWETGAMPLEELRHALRLIGAAKRVIGADVTGEWSPGQPRNPLFRAISRFDHPPCEAPTRAQLERNEEVNAALYTSFLASLSLKE